MTRSKNRFLYLALVLFLGIITVLVTDGYLGRYDTLTLKSGEGFEQVFEADYWQDNAPYAYFGAPGGDTIQGSYTVDNRTFSDYSGHLSIYLERAGQVISRLTDTDFTVGSFGTMEFNFTIETVALSPIAGDAPLEYSLVISHGDTERRIIFSVSRLIIPQLTVVGGEPK